VDHQQTPYCAPVVSILFSALSDETRKNYHKQIARLLYTQGFSAVTDERTLKVTHEHERSSIASLIQRLTRRISDTKSLF